MKQRVWGVQVLKTNTNAIMVGLMMLAITPVFCSLLAPTEASALSLPGIVKDLTAPVTDFLPKKTTPGHPAPSSTPGESRQATAASNITPSAADAPTSASQPIEYGEPLEPMPVYTQRLEHISTQSQYTVRPVVAHGLRTAQNSSLAFLQPSEQGWRIFGTPWYLWALIIVAIVAGWWWIAVQNARYLYLSLFGHNSL